MKDDNFFKLFGLEEKFEIDASDLTSRYRALQSQVHPDKFANATEKERLLSIHKAALVNEAYHTLKGPLLRAKYMLLLRGLDLDNDQSAALMAADFLMEQMELRERLAEIQHSHNPTDLLDDIFKEIQTKEQALISNIALNLSKENKATLENAADEIRQLQFFLKLKEEAGHLESRLNV